MIILEIEDVIKEKGISINTLNKKGIIRNQSWSNYQNGKGLSLNVIDRFCEFAGVPLDKVLVFIDTSTTEGKTEYIKYMLNKYRDKDDTKALLELTELQKYVIEHFSTGYSTTYLDRLKAQQSAEYFDDKTFIESCVPKCNLPIIKEKVVAEIGKVVS